ncbi:HCP-like protein [Yamadazyma tenuis ATCC 10573]|nr:HCP-like protein [Yamadazyma tenuis ATCC 10573]EGV63025.1 HCP-like protein [Yamadazyma tenuis ATCC 10573]
MVLFQFAQYMLQTALLLDTDAHNSGPTSVENSPKRGPADGTKESSHKHEKSKSGNSFDLSKLDDNSVNDKRLRIALLKEAVIYLRKLADKGYVDAQYLLGDACSSGALGKVDNKEAFVLFQAAAKHGHVESAFRTSYCYEEGLGTGRDARKAIEYLKMAASKNHAAAMYKLGVYSFYGRMGLSQTDVNVKKMGIKWLSRASNVATELIAAAPYELGKIYFHGFKDIVITDKKYALELYSQAAALGHVESSALLGHFYEVGEIVPQDSNLSIHYYTQAALGGDPNSMLAMCAWYLVGNDPFLPKDENESFEWAKRAAMCNLAKGQFALANFYDKGIGCDKNASEAQKWYIKAGENGDEKAIGRITDKELAAKLQKAFKKKKPDTQSVPSIASNLNFDSKSVAQEKDCVIM